MPTKETTETKLTPKRKTTKLQYCLSRQWNPDILKARNNILPNFSNISKSSGSSNCLFCNAKDINVHFIHCQNMDDNQDLISLVQNFWKINSQILTGSTGTGS
jgi:hypothetical protein